jgi:hypothetical protein
VTNNGPKNIWMLILIRNTASLQADFTFRSFIPGIERISKQIGGMSLKIICVLDTIPVLCHILMRLAVMPFLSELFTIFVKPVDLLLARFHLLSRK